MTKIGQQSRRTLATFFACAGRATCLNFAHGDCVYIIVKPGIRISVFATAWCLHFPRFSFSLRIFGVMLKKQPTEVTNNHEIERTKTPKVAIVPFFWRAFWGAVLKQPQKTNRSETNAINREQNPVFKPNFPLHCGPIFQDFLCISQKEHPLPGNSRTFL